MDAMLSAYTSYIKCLSTNSFSDVHLLTLQFKYTHLITFINKHIDSTWILWQSLKNVFPFFFNKFLFSTHFERHVTGCCCLPPIPYSKSKYIYIIFNSPSNYTNISSISIVTYCNCIMRV